MNKKNKKSFDLIKEIIEQPKLEKVLSSIEQEQLETAIYRILIDIELDEKILADKNKWIVELLNETEQQQKEIKELKKITKAYNSYIGGNMPISSTIIIADSEYFMNGTFVNNYISKDKIKENLKELEEVLLLTNDAEVAKDTMSKIEILGVLLNE